MDVGLRFVLRDMAVDSAVWIPRIFNRFFEKGAGRSVADTVKGFASGERIKNFGNSVWGSLKTGVAKLGETRPRQIFKSGWEAFQSQSPFRQNLMIGALAGTYGYASSDSMESGDSWLRAGAFAAGGTFLTNRLRNPEALAHLKKAGISATRGVSGKWVDSVERSVDSLGGSIRSRRVVASGYDIQKGQRIKFSHGFQKVKLGQLNYTDKINEINKVGFFEGRGRHFGQAGREFSRFLGIKRWNLTSSVIAGGIYGAISNDTTIGGGMVAGTGLHLGFKTFQKGILAMGTRRKEGMAWNKALTLSTGIGAGMMWGAWPRGMEEGPETAGGALRGSLRGATMGLGAVSLIRHPAGTIIAGGAGAQIVGAVGTSYRNFQEGGGVGTGHLEADGELALALHTLRHRY